MTIAEAREKCKSVVSGIPRDALVLAVVLLASSLAFGLGYLAGMDAGRGSGMRLEAFPVAAPQSVVTNMKDVSEQGQLVASKNGTKYYAPDCAGARRISEANKIWFASVASAVAAGYAPAANCKGI